MSADIAGVAQRDTFLKQMAGFAGAGAAGAVILFVLLIVLVEFGGVDAVLASLAGYVIGAVVSYLLNYYVTFRSDQRHGVAVPKFVVIALIGTALNAAMMQVAVHDIGVHYLVAQAVALVATFFWNFLANRFWTFRR